MTERLTLDPWPSKNHRTWAEVLRLEELSSRTKLSRGDRAELLALSIKAWRFNPPPDPEAVA